jgi:hypothetical protein
LPCNLPGVTPVHAANARRAPRHYVQLQQMHFPLSSLQRCPPASYTSPSDIVPTNLAVQSAAESARALASAVGIGVGEWQ